MADDFIKYLAYFIIFEKINLKTENKKEINIKDIRNIFDNEKAIIYLACGNKIIINYGPIKGQNKIHELINVIFNKTKNNLKANEDKIFNCYKKLICENNFVFNLRNFIIIE